MGVKNKVIKWIFFVFILFISGNFMSIIFATLSATLQTLN